MSAAIALSEMHRQTVHLSQSSKTQSTQEEDSEESESESSHSDQEDDEKEKEPEASQDDKADTKEGPKLTPHAMERMKRAQAVRNLAKDIYEMQIQIEEAVRLSPGLIPFVTIQEKENIFQLFSDVLSYARAPLEAAWRIQGSKANTTERPWVEWVASTMDFVFHAAQPRLLPTPSSLEARLLREVAFIDSSLTIEILRDCLDKLTMMTPLQLSDVEIQEWLDFTKRFELATAHIEANAQPGATSSVSPGKSPSPGKPCYRQCSR